jgi:hypothetical protein
MKTTYHSLATADSSLVGRPNTILRGFPLIVTAAFAALAAPAHAEDPPPPRPLCISITQAPSSDPADPVILIRYCLAPKQAPTWLFLPEGEPEMSRFRGLSVRIDGLEPEHVIYMDHLCHPKRSRSVELQPGESATLRVRLRTIYRFPADWRCIEVLVNESSGNKAEVEGRLTLRRTRVPPDPQTVRTRALIDRLGSPRFAERQAAADALHRLGDDALFHLRRAEAEGQDSEVRRRAGQLVRRIRARHLER